MTTHSSILAQRISRTEERNERQSTGSQSRARLKRLSSHIRVGREGGRSSLPKSFIKNLFCTERFYTDDILKLFLPQLLFSLFCLYFFFRKGSYKYIMHSTVMFPVTISAKYHSHMAFSHNIFLLLFTCIFF